MTKEKTETILSSKAKPRECDCKYCKEKSEEYNDHWMEQW